VKVAFDARMIAHSGIGTYVRGLLGEFARQDHGIRFVVFVPPAVADIPAPPHFDLQRVAVPVYSLAEHCSWAQRLETSACDLVHVPHYNAPWWGTTPLVVTIHDVVHLREPTALRSPVEKWAARRWLAHTARRAAHVLAVSHTAAADVCRALHIERERVTVTHNGVDARFTPQPRDRVEAFRARLELPAEFLLYVGLRRAHKNVPALVRAFLRARTQGAGGAVLVLWGHGDERDRDTRVALRLAGDAVQVRDLHLPAADMPLLYAAARALALPSRYEGFGLPALEAMACGVPVLCSNAGALPEVVGDAACIVSGTDEAAMAAGIVRVLNDAVWRRGAVARGLQRAVEFTWSGAAARTRRVYARLAASAAR
jgi:glycosyltransferase involved in cell wall biosynthesis